MLSHNDEKLNRGYIRLFRCIDEWEWYTDIPVKVLFFHILLKANHVDKEWRGIKIKRGSFLTSRENLAISTGLTVQQVRTAIKKLKLTNELTIKTTSQYSIISINNYDLYQNNNQQINKQITNEQPATNQQPTTTNNEAIMNNNELINNNKTTKNKKEKIFVVPKIEEIKEYCVERKNNIDAEYFYDYYSSKGWLVGKSKMKDWKAAVRNWERNNNNFNKNQNGDNNDEYTFI